jgi:hypothetical protein
MLAGLRAPPCHEPLCDDPVPTFCSVECEDSEAARVYSEDGDCANGDTCHGYGCHGLDTGQVKLGLCTSATLGFCE